MNHSIGACAPANPTPDPLAFRLRVHLLDGARKVSAQLSGDEEYRDRLIREVIQDETVLDVDILELAELEAYNNRHFGLPEHAA